jgi:hypothetical protein
MRFVQTKTREQQGCLSLHRTPHLLPVAHCLGHSTINWHEFVQPRRRKRDYS